MRAVYLVVLLLSLSLVVDVDAGWKFWKKKKDNSTSAEALDETGAVSSTTVVPSSTQKATTPSSIQRGTTPASPKTGIAAAADPALAIGVGNTGGRIREDARNQPRRPNPGTDVGLDISQPKPVRPGLGPAPAGQGYRDWAADLTGAGDPTRPKPKIPELGPALAGSGPQQPNQGNRPTSLPGSFGGQQPAVVPGGKPASAPGTPTVQQKPTPVPTSTASPTPAKRPQPVQPKPTVNLPQPGRQDFPQLPGSPGGSLTPTSPTGSKSYADIAGGGSRPGSPTPTPRSPSSSPNKAGKNPFDYPVAGNNGQAGRPSAYPGAAVVAGGAAAAAGAAAAGAAAANSGKVYSSNPTYSKGKGVTDEDLEKLSEALFIKDVNNANKYITLNLQKTTSGSSTKDEAPQPLLQVKPEALQIPTIQKVLSIYDNYKLDTREHEHINPAQREEESLLIDTFLSTNVMSTAMRFLADKNFLKKDYYEYKDTLRTMWFNLYSRGEGRIGSTGFEHVFLTELKLGTEVSGLHNWIYFNAEEVKQRLDYLGYIKKVDLGNKAAIVKAHVRFSGIDKPVTNIFIGTSPELEMALYTVCFLVRPDTQCPVSLGGTKFNIITHKFRYRGRDLIGSAYPEI